jgi:hypothetical protein
MGVSRKKAHKTLAVRVALERHWNIVRGVASGIMGLA